MIANAVGTGAARAVPFSDEISAEIRAELLEEDAAARARVQRIREKAEVQGRASGGGFEDKLCATPFGVDVVGITEAIALIGALVGGISARQRKREVEIVNEKLRRVNLSLRQQARAGTLYAPGLRYAPSASATATAIPSIVDETAAPVVVVSGDVHLAEISVAACGVGAACNDHGQCLTMHDLARSHEALPLSEGMGSYGDDHTNRTELR